MIPFRLGITVDPCEYGIELWGSISHGVIIIISIIIIIIIVYAEQRVRVMRIFRVAIMRVVLKGVLTSHKEFLFTPIVRSLDNLR